MRKISKQNFKSFFMWVIIFALTLIISMSGAYAYFTATAEKQQSSLTTGIIKVGFVADSTKIVETGSSTQVATKIVPGSSVTYQGLVQNTGTADMYAVLECHVTVDGNTVQTQYYTATGTKLTYEDAQNAFTTDATPIAVNATSQFKIEFVFDTGYDNSYKNKSATLQVVARAIQQSHLTAVQATNQLLSGYIPADALPAAYTRLEYITTQYDSTSKKGAYLDTGVYPSTTTNIGVEMKYQTSTSGVWMFGSRTSMTSTDNFGLFSNNTTQFWAQVGGSSSTTGGRFNYTVTGTHTIKLTTKDFTYDGNKSTFTTSLTGTAKYPLVIGTMNSAGSIDNRYFVGNIYYCNIYSGDTLLKKYIPCKRNTDGKVGLYDAVSKEFKVSSNSSYDFVAGPTA